MQRFLSSKWLVIGFIAAALFVFNSAGNAAGFVPAKKDKAIIVQETVQQIMLYKKAEQTAFTLAGFEQFLGRKLSRKEKRIFTVYNFYTELTPEEEAAMIKNKRLGNLSMIMGIAGYMVMFIPYVSALTIALWPAAIITGIIALTRAKKFDNRKGSGFASGLAGLLTGGLGLVLSFLVVLLVLALWQ
ncbi:hypothetical protein [Phnomibacter sp. MR]|uniref:hypothetical protein n=1 Tax=Phnomibacter sp. MR TaxID=3042318 RepID=UPI003A807C9C